MQRNNKHFFVQRILVFLWLGLMMTTAYAGTPLWTFEPLTATTMTVPSNGTATVQYRITNQSSKPHTLTMQPIGGITQNTTGLNACGNPFVLRGKQSCILSLQIGGSQLNSPIMDGPVVCQQGSTNQCYRPSSANILRITRAPAAEAMLTVTPSTLTLSVTGLTTTTGNDSGMPRFFTIENTGPDTARSIACPMSDSPSIASIVCAGCDNLANGDSCTVTITPTDIPSAAVGNTTPTPISLTIEGSNTNTLSPTVNVLTYGSFYQAGWLFSIIETADTSLSIGGTVAAESDNSGQLTTTYSPGGANTTAAMYSGTEGLSNTNAMVAQYGAGTYSATVCTSYTGGGYTDWYLPAICQISFGGNDDNFNCGPSPGVIPNMQFNLLVTNPTQDFNFINNGFYWSSTASKDFAPTLAWFQQFAVGGGGTVQFNFVGSTFGVRCVRAIT